MTVDFRYRDKIPVGIVGATGIVGQYFVDFLQDHPWFVVAALSSSVKNVGKRYGQAVDWRLASPIPKHISEMELRPSNKELPCSVIFSALDASVAGEIETELAGAGYFVISNARNHRMDDAVPLIVPEVNPDHLDLLNTSKEEKKGFIVTGPNCCAGPLSLALKPLVNAFGVEAVQVVTMQAVSGAGTSGLAALSVLDNVIPSIDGEAEKIEQEPLKILGEDAIQISAQCNRVPVIDGHLLSVSLKLEKKVKEEDLVEAWREFKGEPQGLELPSAPMHPIHYMDEKLAPQPRFHRNKEQGMAISIGQLKDCSIQDFRFVILSHNMVRGAAGNGVLTAELLVKKGHIFW